MKKQLNEAFALHQQGRWEEAEKGYRRILFRDPKNVQALFFLGTLCCQKKDFAQALQHLQSALALNRNFAEAHNSLGNAQQMMENLEAAEASYSKALALKPDMVSARDNLALVYAKMAERCRDKMQFSEAKVLLEKALKLVPNNPFVLNNYGVVLKDLDLPEEALKNYEQALKLKPGYTEALGNLAYIYKEKGDCNLALKCLDELLSLDPKNARARFNRGLLLWDLFEYQQAFVDIEARLETEKFSYVKNYRQPLWQGQDLRGKTLLIYLEQGLTEQISAVLLLRDVLPLCGRCVVECEPRLASLLERSFPAVEFHAVDRLKSSAFFTDTTIDYQTPSWSLLRHFRRSQNDFPQHRGFIVPWEDLDNLWRERLKDLGPGPKIGICWRSVATTFDPANRSQRDKASSCLEQWQDLLQLPGCTFVNLQYGDVAAELEKNRKEYGLRLVDWPDLDLKNDLESLAALVKNLDLVISINSFAAYLANAVGTKVFMLSHRGFKGSWPDVFAGDPEYPQITYLRQKKSGDWEELFGRVQVQVQKLFFEKRGS